VHRSAASIVVAAAVVLAGGGVAAAATNGTVLGGKTGQDWPIVIELNKAGTQVVRISAGLHLTCTSGGVVNLPDEYTKLKVSPSGKFGLSFGPTNRKNDDGTSTDFQGSITGKLNKARTTATGKWTFKGIDKDAAGTVTDTCDSGSVSWKAKA
jgi:hypothetical protein